MLISLCMITIKTKAEVQDRFDEALRNMNSQHEFIFVSNPDGGVAENRNKCLRQAKGDIIIFVDDDLYGYQSGWDMVLVDKLNEDPDALMVGLRLLNSDGSTQNTVSKCEDINSDYVKVQWLPGAIMAYRKNSIFFNEQYKYWSPEDIEFEHILKKANPGKYLLLCNKFKLIHANEMKNMHKFGDQGKAIFRSRWGFLVE